jgi:SAM-dependent methyltransferase
MNALYVLALVVAAAVGGSLWWRRSSRQRPLPCPARIAWSIDNPLADRLLGTQTTLDRIGLKPGQRVLEVGPGRLLIPAARRVLPGGEVVGLDIQAGMLERLKARAAQQGVSNLTMDLGDAAFVKGK